MTEVRLLLVLLFFSVPLASPGTPDSFGVAEMSDVMVPMRDGVSLATDVYLPTIDGAVVSSKLPTILTRSPYNKEGSGTVASAHYYVSRGYAFVAQDTRGRYKSEGVWHMLDDDGKDGYDAVRWIGRQTWSNGKVGMIGTSYVGGTQHAVALEKAPELVTIIPVDAMSNLGHASMRNGGAFELRFWNWLYRNAANGSRQSRDPGTASILHENSENRHHYLMNLPLRYGTTPLKLASEYEDWLVQGMRNGSNGEFWEQNNIVDFPERYKDIPVYLVGGWYDSWASNTTANYRVLSEALESDVYLIMGPWIHGRQGSFEHGQVSFGTGAAIEDPLGWRLEWYDHWLKGEDNDVGKKEPFASNVRVFVMGTGDGKKTTSGTLNHGGYWRDELSWPLPRTTYTPYYFHQDGSLSTVEPETSHSSTSFVFDPEDPVPTIGGNISSGNGILLQGGWDQRGGSHVWNWQVPLPLSARNDVVVFQSDVLNDEVEVVGEIEVKLWVSSDAVDTDFTAKLIDVYPPSADFPGGFDLNIGDGIIRTRFRDSIEEENMMEPGTIYPVSIKLYPTGNIFKKGHRIRVDISSSNFPRFDVNPNTGEPLNQHRRKIIAVNTVHHDVIRSSHIILPIVPTSQRRH